MNTLLFMDAKAYGDWKKDQLDREIDSMYWEITKVSSPVRYPALLVFQWLQTQSGFLFLHHWVQAGDLNEKEPLPVRIENKDGSWTTVPTPIKPITKTKPPEKITVIRAITLE